MTRSRAGMTLIELVIAITIVAMMATAGGAAFSTIIDRQQTLRTASSEVERAAALRETIRQWILQGAIQVPRGGLPQGARSGAAGRQLAAVAPGASMNGSATTAGVTSAASTSTANEFTVVTSAPNPLMTANVRIRIFVDADDNTPEQGLTIEYQASTQTPLLRRQLDPAVGDLTIEYFDPTTGLWATSADASPAQAVAIRITMVPVEGMTLPRLLTLPLTIVYGELPQ